MSRILYQYPMICEWQLFRQQADRIGTVACQAISEWTQQYMIDHPDAKVAFLPLISDRYEGVIPAGAHVRAIKVSWTKAAGIPVPIFQSILTGEFMPI